MMNVYITTMIRWGSRETHSYIIGVFTDFDVAVKAGEDEADWRGGKYTAIVEEAILDKNYGCGMKPLPKTVYEGKL